MTPPATSLVLIDEPRVPADRGWARDLLARAGVSQRDLARAWGMSEANTSRWLDGKLSRDLSVGRAAAFCRLTKTSLEEMAWRMGHATSAGEPGEPSPIGAPPLGTVRINQAPPASVGWDILLHLRLSADYLVKLQSALEEIAAGMRLKR